MRSARDVSSQRREPRDVNSAVHPDQLCEQCALCKKTDFSKYSHPKSWKNPSLLQQLQVAEPFLNIQPESCICLLCRRDVSKVSDVSFSPRWRRCTNIVKLCYIPDCLNTDIKVSKSVNVQELALFFPVGDIDDATVSTVDGTDDIPLCSHHYMQWYKHTHSAHSNCKTCGKKFNKYSKSRPVPEPELLQRFLNTNTEFSDILHPGDRVCYVGYKSHLVAVKQMNYELLTVNTDAGLTDLIVDIKQNLPTTLETWENIIDYTARSLAVRVGEALLKQTAILLPRLYATFKLEVDSVAKNIKVDKEDQDFPSNAWVRNSLSSLLKHHMAYRCTIRKYGTLLYRQEGDLVHALTVALGQGNTTLQSIDDNATCMLTKVCENINNKLHDQANKLITTDTYCKATQY